MGEIYYGGWVDFVFVGFVKEFLKMYFFVIIILN